MYKFWPGQALSMTIFSFDSQCDLVSNDIASSQGEQLCQIILKLMHKCRSYGPDKLNWWPFYIIWPSSVTLTFNLPEQIFQMAFLLVKENKCAKLFSNPRINVEVMAQTSSIYDHFIIWPSTVTSNFNLPEQMFQMALLLLKENDCGNFFKIKA